MTDQGDFSIIARARATQTRRFFVLRPGRQTKLTKSGQEAETQRIPRLTD
jgi:hypothetical protein